jgi:hypothetical protein
MATAIGNSPFPPGEAIRGPAETIDHRSTTSELLKPTLGGRSVRFATMASQHWHGLRLDEDTWSGSKVNRLIGEFLGQALPSIDFAHGDLT